MNHVILPPGHPQTGTLDECIEVSEVSLGGCFYDYLRAGDGRIVGVRYWLIDDTSFSHHPVYSLFLGDDRFAFDPAGSFVDIAFEKCDAGLLQQRQLSLDAVQEFGGERVVKCGEWLGIAFSLADDQEQKP